MDQATLDRIEKTRTMMERATTQGEAEAALAAMTRLLTRHGLSMADVTTRLDRPTAPEFGKHEGRYGANTTWRHILLNALANANDCNNVRLPGTDTYWLVGRRDAAEAVMAMFDTAVAQIDRMAERAWSDYRAALSWHDAGYARRWKTDFRFGCVAGINTALRAARKAEIDDNPNGRALVALNKQALEDATRKHFPRLGSGRAPSRSVDHRAYGMGVQAGRSMDLNHRAAIDA